MWKAVLVWSSIALGAGLTGPSQAQDFSCIFSANKPATVYIEYTYVTNEGTGTERGSGFIISPQGHLLTNAHVVTPRFSDIAVQSEKIVVRVGGLANDPVEARVVLRDSSVDLALIQLPPRPGEPWPTVAVGGDVNLPVGAAVVGIGYSNSDVALVPSGRKTAENTIVDGQLKPWWQTNLGLNPGNSGGPVFGELGTVVGVAVAKNDGAQLITYIIPIARAQHILDFANVSRAQFGSCAVFPECRHSSHGIERYMVDEQVSRWGGWRGGGYNRTAHCNDYLTNLRVSYPNSEFEFVGDNEQSRERSFRHFEYRYFCEFRRKAGPIYANARSQACLPREAKNDLPTNLKAVSEQPMAEERRARKSSTCTAKAT